MKNKLIVLLAIFTFMGIRDGFGTMPLSYVRVFCKTPITIELKEGNNKKKSFNVDGLCYYSLSSKERLINIPSCKNENLKLSIWTTPDKGESDKGGTYQLCENPEDVFKIKDSKHGGEELQRLHVPSIYPEEYKDSRGIPFIGIVGLVIEKNGLVQIDNRIDDNRK